MNLDALNPAQQMFIYGPTDVLINILLSVALGLGVSWVYMRTHKGLSYSQSFVLTLVLVTVIVSSVIMVIGNSLARAFALVGALSIIRFRTVVKDTKDVAYVFFALATGLAAGTSNYFLAFASTILISALAVILDRLNYGALYKSEFILRFMYDRDAGGEEEYVDKLGEMCKRSNLLHVEPSGDGRYLTLTYDLVLKEDVTSQVLAQGMDKLTGISAVTLIASKSDVDF